MRDISKWPAKRGVKFDVGHGGGSFHFPNAEPLVRQGFWPDSISTDLHSGSVNGAMIDMLNVMSKFLALGVPLPEVIRESTTNPATEIRRPSWADRRGRRRGPGGPASGTRQIRLRRRKGRPDRRAIERLGCEMTLRAGKIVYDLNGRAAVPWRGAGIAYPTR